MGEAPGRDPPSEAGAASDEDFGWRGWLLVAAVFVAFVAVPVTIYLQPPGVPFVFAYIVLALVPGVLLALLAVWVTTRP